MATRRQSIPSFIGYTPPKVINQSATNLDVKLFVYNFIRGYDDDLDEYAAWEIARKAIGDGEAVLGYRKDEWIELLDDWGDIIYEEIQSHSFTVLDLYKTIELKNTKGFGIASLIYTGVIQILYAITSSRWVENSTIQTFFKHRPAKSD